MSRSKKTDWWEILLWVGVLGLAIVFLYQLMRLWNAGVATAANLPAAIMQALANTAAAIGNALSGLFTSGPLSLLAFIPAVVGMLLSLLSPLPFIGPIFSSIANLFSNLFGTASTGLLGFSTPAPTTIYAGYGSSFFTAPPLDPGPTPLAGTTAVPDATPNYGAVFDGPGGPFISPYDQLSASFYAGLQPGGSNGFYAPAN